MAWELVSWLLWCLTRLLDVVGWATGRGWLWWNSLGESGVIGKYANMYAMDRNMRDMIPHNYDNDYDNAYDLR